MDLNLHQILKYQNNLNDNCVHLLQYHKMYYYQKLILLKLLKLYFLLLYQLYHFLGKN